MLVCNVNLFCKTLKTSLFRNFLQPVMRYGKFRGNFQKMESIFISCLYTTHRSCKKSQSQKGFYGRGRNQDKMVTTAPFLCLDFSNL